MIRISIPPLGIRRAGRIRPLVVVRIAIAAVAVCLAIAPALSAERLRLRAEVTASSDVLTLADLAEGAAGSASDTPLFRSPLLGESGTIQASRIVEAARRLNVAIDSGGRSEILVTRPARRVGTAEIEAAIRQALEARHGLDAHANAIVFDGTPPALVVAPEAKEPVVADDVTYDRRTRRLGAKVRVGQRGSLSVSGTAVEVAEVAVLNRTLNRGDTVQSADVTVERRAKESAPADAQSEPASLVGRIARRNLATGTVVRVGDLGKPELVTRGESVTVVYEVPGMTLTLRARASESGTQGDTVSVVNLQSKKTLQGTVVAAGKVAVVPATPARLASVATPSPPATAEGPQ
jgi:flagella basal body P-ring formation protein FlgA